MPVVLGILDGSDEGKDCLEEKKKIWVRKREHQRTYIVLADTVNDTEEEIKGASGVPPLFFPLNGCVCNDRTAEEVQTVVHPLTGVTTILWHVKCNFTSGLNASDQDQPPEAKRPQVRWDSRTEDEVLEFDVGDARPIQTDAGEPMIITAPGYIFILEVTRYEVGAFDPKVKLLYEGCANSAPFYGAPQETAVLAKINAEEEWLPPHTGSGPDQLYNKVTYTIEFKIRRLVVAAFGLVTVGDDLIPLTQRSRVLHAGYKYRKEAGAPSEIYLDKAGNPQQVNLALGTGVKLAEGADPQYKMFQRLYTKDFNALSLGPF